MTTGASTYKESDGKSVTVRAGATVVANQVAVIEGWLGIAVRNASSGDYVALRVDQQEYQFVVPSGLSVAKGDVVYIEVADLTGHTPDDTAYSTTSGAGKRAFFRATAAKDSNNVVTGIMLMGV